MHMKHILINAATEALAYFLITRDFGGSSYSIGVRSIGVIKKMNDSIKLIAVLVVGLVIGAGAMYMIAPPGGTGTTTYIITTAGSTTVYPLSQEWATQFHADFPAMTVNPSTGGSGLGQSQVADELIDIGASSSYPNSDYRTANPNVKIIPVSADALGIVANPAVNGSNFKMDCDMAVAIFQGNITTWEVFETAFNVVIAATGDINVYVRSDASGTTATFGKWLKTAGANPNPYQNYTWGLGDSESISWPAGISAVEGNPGVAAGVLGDTSGIGYVGLAFMEDLAVVDLYNPTIQEYITPNLENALKALPAELTDPGANLMNSANTGAYPIARLLYYLVNEDNLAWYVIVYLNWVLAQGQQYISDVGYVPISGTSAVTYALSVVGDLIPS
ncbi:MAG: PstS family phosphate ABC transporter substrate-binding protein [Candidatus Thorarchaeota archaeon]|nr:PstS family phosphate ABC transporter substrate-binding protein [Candidatus Thorarchaeota archaeon]